MSDESSAKNTNLKTEVVETKIKHTAFLVRRWRRLNAIILLIAFFAPWLRTCVGAGGVYTGLTITFFPEELFGYWPTVSGLSFIIYVVLNLIRATTGKQPHIVLLIASLGGSIFFLLMSILIAADYRWGYFLAWLGILSSILVEVKDYRNRPPPPEQHVAS